MSKSTILFWYSNYLAVFDLINNYISIEAAYVDCGEAEITESVLATGLDPSNPLIIKTNYLV